MLAILLFNEKERNIAEEVVHRMVERAVEMEGTVTGEHGVGMIKRDYLAHELGESTVDAMRKLKFAFDPLCILNCDKIVRVERFDEMNQARKSKVLSLTGPFRRPEDE